MATKSRPATCSAFAATSPAYLAARPASVTCKRLPNHKGECRVTLHEPKAAKPTAKASRKAAPKATIAEVALQMLADGAKPSEVLAFVAKASRKPARKPAKVTRTAPKATAEPLRFGMIGQARTGFEGRVTKVNGDRVTLRAKDGESKVFVLASVTRVVRA